jgi:uncharacterized repeat protein (TIGR01451 family)
MLTYTITVEHTAIISTTNVLVTDTIPVNSTFITATTPFTQDGDTIGWSYPIMEALMGRSVDLVLRVPEDLFGEIINEKYGVRSDQVLKPVMGKPVKTKVGYFSFLPIVKLANE